MVKPVIVPELSIDILGRDKVSLDTDSATFGTTKINYLDIQDLVLNSSNDTNVGAAAVINVRSREPSPLTGLERHKILEFQFAPDAKELAESFATHVNDLNIHVKKTNFANSTFTQAFFTGKRG